MKRSRQIKEEERAMPNSKNNTKSRTTTISQKEGPAPDLPPEFQNRIAELNGRDIKFLMSKKLSMSDLSRNSNRLSLPLKKFMCDFLTDAEKAILNGRKGTRRSVPGLEITLLDPSLRLIPIQLKKWEMKSTDIYNLVKTWNDVVIDNELEQDQEIHIWSFRVHDKLHLLLRRVCVVPPWIAYSSLL